MRSDEPAQLRKILLLEANPNGTLPLRLTKELRRIIDSLKQSNRRDRFEIIVETAVTIAHIQQALLEHQPEIVHFCGHGAGTDGIVCEDESGDIKLIPTAALGDLFKLVKGHVKCVVLNACYSEIQANEIFKHIEYVVGMKSSIGDEAALRFAEGFYIALFAGKEFADCHQWGVNTIQLASIPEDSTPIIKMKVPVKKTVKAHSKKLSEVSINSTQENLTAPSPALNEPALGNPDPALSTSPPQIPAAKRHSLLQRMPKSAFLSLLIPVFLYIIFIRTGKQYEFAGNYMQESNQAEDQKEKEKREDGETSKHIRWVEVRTTLNVFPDSQTGKLVAVENTFWRVYYAPDLNHLELRFFIGSSEAEFVHREYGRQGNKIQMHGKPIGGWSGLQVEPLLGDKKLVEEINNAVSEEIAKVKENFKGVWTEWSLDEGANLIKEKWYDTKEGLDKKNRGEPGKKEKFLRQY